MTSKETKTEFEKSFCKLMNNSVFGKTLENVNKHMEKKLTTDKNEGVKYVSKPHFKSVRYIDVFIVVKLYKKDCIKQAGVCWLVHFRCVETNDDEVPS